MLPAIACPYHDFDIPTPQLLGEAGAVGWEASRITLNEANGTENSAAIAAAVVQSG